MGSEESTWSSGSVARRNFILIIPLFFVARLLADIWFDVERKHSAFHTFSIGFILCVASSFGAIKATSTEIKESTISMAFDSLVSTISIMSCFYFLFIAAALFFDWDMTRILGALDVMTQQRLLEGQIPQAIDVALTLPVQTISLGMDIETAKRVTIINLAIVGVTFALMFLLAPLPTHGSRSGSASSSTSSVYESPHLCLASEEDKLKIFVHDLFVTLFAVAVNVFSLAPSLQMAQEYNNTLRAGRLADSIKKHGARARDMKSTRRIGFCFCLFVCLSVFLTPSWHVVLLALQVLNHILKKSIASAACLIEMEIEEVQQQQEQEQPQSIPLETAVIGCGGAGGNATTTAATTTSSGNGGGGGVSNVERLGQALEQLHKTMEWCVSRQVMVDLALRSYASALAPCAVGEFLPRLAASFSGKASFSFQLPGQPAAPPCGGGGGGGGVSGDDCSPSARAKRDAVAGEEEEEVRAGEAGCSVVGEAPVGAAVAAAAAGTGVLGVIMFDVHVAEIALSNALSNASEHGDTSEPIDLSAALVDGHNSDPASKLMVFRVENVIREEQEEQALDQGDGRCGEDGGPKVTNATLQAAKQAALLRARQGAAVVAAPGLKAKQAPPPTPGLKNLAKDGGGGRKSTGNGKGRAAKGTAAASNHNSSNSNNSTNSGLCHIALACQGAKGWFNLELGLRGENRRTVVFTLAVPAAVAPPPPPPPPPSPPLKPAAEHAAHLRTNWATRQSPSSSSSSSSSSSFSLSSLSSHSVGVPDALSSGEYDDAPSPLQSGEYDDDVPSPLRSPLEGPPPFPQGLVICVIDDSKIICKGYEKLVLPKLKADLSLSHVECPSTEADVHAFVDRALGSLLGQQQQEQEQEGGDVEEEVEEEEEEDKKKKDSALVKPVATELGDGKGLDRQDDVHADDDDDKEEEGEAALSLGDEQAMGKPSRRAADVVVLDQHIIVENEDGKSETILGTDIAQRLREFDFSGLVIIRSANAFEEDVGVYLRTGAVDGCLGKDQSNKDVCLKRSKATVGREPELEGWPRGRCSRRSAAKVRSSKAPSARAPSALAQ